MREQLLTLARQIARAIRAKGTPTRCTAVANTLWHPRGATPRGSSPRCIRTRRSRQMSLLPRLASDHSPISTGHPSARIRKRPRLPQVQSQHSEQLYSGGCRYPEMPLLFAPNLSRTCPRAARSRCRGYRAERRTSCAKFHAVTILAP